MMLNPHLRHSLLALAVILAAFLSTTNAQEETSTQEEAQPTETATDTAQTVEQEQSPSERAGLGVTLGIDRYSVFVKFAYPNSPAALSGIRSGARIHEINEQKCATVDETIDLIHSFQPGETADVRISQDGQFHTIAVTFSTVAAAFGATPLQNQDTLERMDASDQKIGVLAQRVGSLATLTNQIKAEGDQKIATLTKSIADRAASTDTKLAAMQKTLADEIKLRDVKLAALEKAIVDSVKAGDVRIADLKKAVDSLRTLPNGLTKAENDIATLKQTATNVGGNLASLTKRLQTLEGKIATLSKPAPAVQQNSKPSENKPAAPAPPEPSESANP